MNALISAYRETARLALFDDQQRILMIKIEDSTVHDPKQPQRKPFWVTPGGKVEEGETAEIAAKRELFEETGIKEADEFGPCIWKGSVVLNWKGVHTQLNEKFFLARVKSQNVSRKNFTEEEEKVIKEHRWFSSEDLESTQEIFIPKDLALLVREILEGNIPVEKEIDLSTPKM